MKKLILIVCSLLVFFSAFSKEPKKQFIKKGKQLSYSINVFKDIDQGEQISIDSLENNSHLLLLYHNRFCMKNFYLERKKAMGFGMSGVFLVGTGAAFWEDTGAKIITGVGGGICVVSFIMHLTADRWIKYSTIKPTLSLDKVGITINF